MSRPMSRIKSIDPTQVTVVVEVPHGGSAADVRPREIGPQRRPHLAEPPRAVVGHQRAGLLVGHLVLEQGDVVQDVPVHDQQVLRTLSP